VVSEVLNWNIRLNAIIVIWRYLYNRNLEMPHNNQHLADIDLWAFFIMILFLVLLTVHLSIILVIDQLNPQILVL